MIRYHLGWEDEQGLPDDAGGKALRASLCMLASEAVGGDSRRALPAAAAVELVHNFSLIHDDIQDRDSERHDRLTVWSIWGEAQAINAGDALLALARRSLMGLADRGTPPQVVNEAARVLDGRTLEMVEGQTLDISFEGMFEVTVADYMDMAGRKSGALFDCALSLGALAGGAAPQVITKLGQIGRTLGTAFQVRDDVLGVWGDPRVTGKPRGADIRRRKKSLPVVYALEQAEGVMRDELRHAYNKAELSEDDAVLVLQCLDETGARQYCVSVAQESKDVAVSALGELTLHADPAAELRETAEFLLDRDY
jgi:geranylgeranyl diphosphate synthase type I